MRSIVSIVSRDAELAPRAHDILDVLRRRAFVPGVAGVYLESGGRPDDLSAAAESDRIEGVVPGARPKFRAPTTMSNPPRLPPSRFEMSNPPALGGSGSFDEDLRESPRTNAYGHRRCPLAWRELARMLARLAADGGKLVPRLADPGTLSLSVRVSGPAPCPPASIEALEHRLAIELAAAAVDAAGLAGILEDALGTLVVHAARLLLSRFEVRGDGLIGDTAVLYVSYATLPEPGLVEPYFDDVTREALSAIPVDDDGSVPGDRVFALDGLGQFRGPIKESRPGFRPAGFRELMAFAASRLRPKGPWSRHPYPLLLASAGRPEPLSVDGAFLLAFDRRDGRILRLADMAPMAAPRRGLARISVRI